MPLPANCSKIIEFPRILESTKEDPTPDLSTLTLLNKIEELQNTVLLMATAIEQMKVQQDSEPNVNLKIIKTKNKIHSNFTTHEIPKPKAQAADSIKSLDEIKMVFEYFLFHDQYRNYALFVTGISTAYRISDLVSLQYSDFFNTDGTFKFELDVREQKTGKRRKMEITQPIQEAILLYIEKSKIDFEYHSPMFRSDKFKTKAITEETFHKILKESIQRELKLPYNIGTHSMRKTYGYMYLQSHKNDMTALSTLQKIFGHSSERETLKYCGISKEEMRQNNRDVSNLWKGLMNNVDVD